MSGINIETSRLLIRNLTDKDADTIYDYRNNEICARYQRGQAKDYKSIVDMIEQHSCDTINIEAPFMLSVALRTTDEMVGEIVVMPNEGTISLGYTFSYKHHRRGYAYEALSALMELLHDIYPEYEFICFTEPENIPSMMLLRKLGFVDMGYLPSKSSQVFAKWITEQTRNEIAMAVSSAKR